MNDDIGDTRTVWEAPGASALLELDDEREAFIELWSEPTPAGDAAAENLVRAALARARALHLACVHTALDASRPVSGVVLSCLHRQLGRGVDGVECHRAGVTVMVRIDLATAAPAPLATRGTVTPHRSGRSRRRASLASRV